MLLMLLPERRVPCTYFFCVQNLAVVRVFSFIVEFIIVTMCVIVQANAMTVPSS